MTVTYTSQVANCKGFGCFWKLLFRWRGSIYKLVYTDLMAYSMLYFCLSAIYRFALDSEGRRLFEKVSIYTEYFTELIPISFILGFYVSIVVQRWWAQFELLPWPDSLSLYISTSIPGNDNRGRMMRRTIVRYANLSFTLTLIMISPTIKKRFPTLDHLIEAGLLTSNEKKIFDDLSSKTTHPMYWMPLVWAGTVVARARKEGRIRDDFAVKTIIDEINRLRGLCGHLLSYDWISVPLVYTQVVTLAVYSFFLATLMGRQFLDPTMKYEKHNLDIVFPIFTYLQFFFYMGWLKVAESLVNPFGEDDDDFEMNWLIDRNVQISYLIVDEMHNEHPELIQDIYWDEIFPTELPYTIAAQEFRTEPPQGSTANIEVPTEEQEFLPVVDEETADELLGNFSSNQSVSNIKRIGSNLSTIFQNSSNLMSKSSVLSFLHHRSSTSIRKGSHPKNVPSAISKSVTHSPSTTNTTRRGSHPYPTSEVSFSGSDNGLSERSHPHSSKESITTEQTVFSETGRRGSKKRRGYFDDVGIQFNIKTRDKDEAEGKDHRLLDFSKTDVIVTDEMTPGTPTDTHVRGLLWKPKRTISVDLPSTSPHAKDLDRQFSQEGAPREGKEFSPGSSPSKFLDIMKATRRNSSSPSLKDQPLQGTYPYKRHTRSASMNKPYSEYQTKLTPRGNTILRSLSSTTFDPNSLKDAHKYSPLPHASTAPSSAAAEAPMSTALESVPQGQPSTWENIRESEENVLAEDAPTEGDPEGAHDDSNASIWL